MKPKHAFIAPTAYLHLIPESSTFHLLLAHLLVDPAYCAFYRQRQKQGDTILIDNGAFEFKKPLEGAEYRDLVLRSGIVADYVVAPDYPFEHWQKTVDATREFCETAFDYFDYNQTQIMAVPQSEIGDVQGWLKGYKALSNMHANSKGEMAVSMIGMSILGIPNAFMAMTGTKDISYNRIFATAYMKREGLIAALPHHYLGLGDSVRELQIQTELGIMTSNDSSSAFWRGIVGWEEQQLPNYDDSATGQMEGKIKREVDFNVHFDPRVVDDIKYNINFIENMLK